MTGQDSRTHCLEIYLRTETNDVTDNAIRICETLRKERHLLAIYCWNDYVDNESSHLNKSNEDPSLF